MATASKIEWTDATWNPVTGCTRVSAGCDNCYAVKQTYRLEQMGQTEKYGGLTVLNAKGKRHFNGQVKCHDDALAIPIRRRKPTMYFVNSMSDLFHAGVPFDFIDRVFGVMGLCPQHTFQILTKRPERMAEWANRSGRYDCAAAIQNAIDHWEAEDDYPFGDDHAPLIRQRLPFDNVWLGTSVENQEAADTRIPHLLKCPAAVRFLSVEPMLEHVDLTPWFLMQRAGGVRHVKAGQLIADAPLVKAPSIDWVIVGGESGPGARTCNMDWIGCLVDQCACAKVPCFVKQIGSRPYSAVDDIFWGCSDSKGGNMNEWPAELRVREMPT